MPSTPRSSASSTTDRYQGEEYRLALAAPPEPLLHPDPSRPTRPYRLLLILARFLTAVLFRFHVDGLEQVPEPPFIAASNHQAWYDTIFILAALSRARSGRLPMVYTMARRDTVFNRPWKRRLLPHFGIFPIQPQQGELDQTGLRSVYQVLGRGGVVLIFPEGRYSRGRDLRPLRKGVGHFALQAGVPICPIAISGLERLRLRGRSRLSFGPPVWPDPPRFWGFNRQVQRMVDRVRRAILRRLDRMPLDGGRSPLSRARARLRQAMVWATDRMRPEAVQGRTSAILGAIGRAWPFRRGPD
jgi:1-acyl-sn-glycerol-3-phosphate acyltransferase